MIVLFHVTADTRWSNLPLSGAFVEMLKRIVALAGSTATADGDGSARRRARWCRRPASSTASARSARRRRPRGRCRPAITGRATADHPPGFYGPPEGLLAVNTLAPADRLAPLDLAGAQCAPRRLSRGRAAGPARPGPAGGAGAARARCAGGVLAGRRASRSCSRRRAAPAAAAAIALRDRWHARARCRRSRAAARRTTTAALRATLQTRLAYVITGDAEVDRISQRRPAGPHAVPRAAHRARSRRAGRARSRPRRARVLPADLLAGRAGRAAALARGAGAHRRLHEERRHRAVRHPRRHRRRRPAGGGTARPACWRCAPSCRRSTSRSSSRCRATTC